MSTHVLLFDQYTIIGSHGLSTEISILYKFDNLVSAIPTAYFTKCERSQTTSCYPLETREMQEILLKMDKNDLTNFTHVCIGYLHDNEQIEYIAHLLETRFAACEVFYFPSFASNTSKPFMMKLLRKIMSKSKKTCLNETSFNLLKSSLPKNLDDVSASLKSMMKMLPSFVCEELIISASSVVPDATVAFLCTRKNHVYEVSEIQLARNPILNSFNEIAAIVYFCWRLKNHSPVDSFSYAISSMHSYSSAKSVSSITSHDCYFDAKHLKTIIDEDTQDSLLLSSRVVL